MNELGKYVATWIKFKEKSVEKKVGCKSVYPVILLYNISENEKSSHTEKNVRTMVGKTAGPEGMTIGLEGISDIVSDRNIL